ncbi:UNVERIFIED_CONTAM: hypothetical protein HDU68_004909 [Siphonaria sp. JEL0065]|nr:hypothetical protein HDU68_004909 [Siphonaria sp. JEL0065]
MATPKDCQNCFEELIKWFKQDEMDSLCASGTEEEFNECEQLLADIMELPHLIIICNVLITYKIKLWKPCPVASIADVMKVSAASDSAAIAADLAAALEDRKIRMKELDLEERKMWLVEKRMELIILQLKAKDKH